MPPPTPAPIPQPIPPQPDEEEDEPDMAANQDGVLMEEVPDPQRESLRVMKLTEAQINAALGPPKMRPVPVAAPPKVELPDTDQVRSLRAAGMSDEQIVTVLKALEPVATAPVAAPAVNREAPAAPVKSKGGRPPGSKNKPKAEEATVAQAQPEPEPTPVNGSHPTGNGELKAEGESPSMPADLEKLLDNMLGQQPK